MDAFLEGVLRALEDPKTLTAVSATAVGLGGVLIGRANLRLGQANLRRQLEEDERRRQAEEAKRVRDLEEAAHRKAHALAEIEEALQRRKAEREAVLKDKERGRQDIANRRIRVESKFRQDCSTELVRQAGQGLRVNMKAAQVGPPGLVRARAVYDLNLEEVKQAHEIAQRLSAVDTEIEILDEKRRRALGVAR